MFKTPSKCPTSKTKTKLITLLLRWNQINSQCVHVLHWQKLDPFYFKISSYDSYENCPYDRKERGNRKKNERSLDFQKKNGIISMIY